MDTRRVLGLGLLAWAFIACADARETLPISAVAVDGTRIAVQGSCHDGRRLDAREAGDRVELTFSVAAASGGDCFDCVVVELDDPVGDRRLVDTTTGAPVPRGGDPALGDCLLGG